jgi:tetratricopeptide (TPR) repeat protein/predicted Ser/Thr protein kinase
VGEFDSTKAVDSRQDGLAGRLIGNYRIVRQLGTGGMGIVYEAEQQHPKRPVALKIIRGGAYVDEHQIKLFRREAQTLARLKHPSIATIYELGRTEDGQHFFVMELVRGETLSDWLRGHAGADLRTRLEIFRKICEGVAYAHQRGVIHRDLKPSNILVLKESPGQPAGSSPAEDAAPDIKILDFGLARITDQDVTMTSIVSELGSVRGTLPYMSPEQVRGNPDEIDLRTDVYSLGVMLYELLAGRLPYDVQGKPLSVAMRMIGEEPPAPLTRTWSGKGKADADVVTIAHKALEKEPARRYQSVAALGEDVQRYLQDQPILARAPSAAYQLRKLIARHRWGFGVVASTFVLLAALAVTMAVQARRIAGERDRANQETATAKQVLDFLVGLFQVADPGEARGNSITAREILDRGSERIQRELQKEPAVQARLMHVMGDVYRSLGLYEQAAPLLRESLAVREQRYGGDSLEAAETLNTLAFLTHQQGRPQEAQALAERALRIHRARLLPEDARIGWSLYWLAIAENSLGSSKTAKHHVTEALDIFERAIGTETLPVAWCLNDLGVYCADEGEYGSALAFYERALRIREKVLPRGHFDLAHGRNNVGYALLNLGDYDRAEPLLRQAVADFERILGKEHPLTANGIESLGELEWKRGDLGRASELLERALAVFDAKLDRDDPSSTAVALHALACVRRDAGRSKESEALFRRALSIRESKLGPEHPNTRLTRSEYAKLLRSTGRAAEAEVLER